MPTLTLNIKLHSKTLQNVDIESESTIAEVKELLAPLAEVPASQQRLIHRGHLLKDEKKISEYGASRTLACRPHHEAVVLSQLAAAAHADALRLLSCGPVEPAHESSQGVRTAFRHRSSFPGIESGHTVHLVKGSGGSQPASQGSGCVQ